MIGPLRINFLLLGPDAIVSTPDTMRVLPMPLGTHAMAVGGLPMELGVLSLALWHQLPRQATSPAYYQMRQNTEQCAHPNTTEYKIIRKSTNVYGSPHVCVCLRSILCYVLFGSVRFYVFVCT